MTRPFSGKADWSLAEGMEVRDADAYPIGQVRGVRDNGFLLYRPPAGVFLVPFGAIQSVLSDYVVLTIRGEKLAESGCSMIEATPMPSSSLVMPLPSSPLAK